MKQVEKDREAPDVRAQRRPPLERPRSREIWYAIRSSVLGALVLLACLVLAYLVAILWVLLDGGVVCR